MFSGMSFWFLFNYIWSAFRQTNQCDGLNENGSHMFIYLSSWAPFGRSIWEALGSVATLKEVFHWREACEVSKANGILSVSLLLPCVCGSGCNFSATSPVLCLPACLWPWSIPWLEWTSLLKLQASNKLFLLWIILVIMSYNNNRKLTRTPGNHRITNVISSYLPLKHHRDTCLSMQNLQKYLLSDK